MCPSAKFDPTFIGSKGCPLEDERCKVRHRVLSHTVRAPEQVKGKLPDLTGWKMLCTYNQGASPDQTPEPPTRGDPRAGPGACTHKSGYRSVIPDFKMCTSKIWGGQLDKTHLTRPLESTWVP